MHFNRILFAIVASVTLVCAAPAPQGYGGTDISLEASENINRDRFSATRFDSHTHDKSFSNTESDTLDASRRVDLDIDRGRRPYLKERSSDEEDWYDGWNDLGDGKHEQDTKHDSERHHEDEKHHWIARQEQGRRPEPPRPGPPPPPQPYPPQPYPPPYYPPYYPPRPHPH